MSSARPVRTSARQSALREQERHEQSESRFSRISSRSEQALAGEYSDATQGQGLSLATSASLDVTDMSPSVQPHPIEGYSDTVEIEPLQPFVDPDISHLPELAFAYGFLVKFKSLLKQSGPLPDFTIEDLETGMISVTPNACVAEIHANLLSNLQNRKKAVDTHAWQKVLSEILDTKQRTGEYPYENPLRLYKSYYQVEPRDRVEILKDLIDWVLQEGVAIRSGIEQDPEAFSVEPFGTDKEKWVYWYFGDGALRVYREKALRSKRHIWETVASDLDGIKALVDTFKDSTVRVEIELRDRLRTDIIEPIEERSLQNEKKQERMERKMQKIAELHEIAALKSTRTRSSNRTNQVRYTFDEEEDFEEEDVYAIYRRHPSHQRSNQDEFEQRDSQPQPQVDQTSSSAAMQIDVPEYRDIQPQPQQPLDTPQAEYRETYDGSRASSVAPSHSSEGHASDVCVALGNINM